MPYGRSANVRSHRRSRVRRRLMVAPWIVVVVVSALVVTGVVAGYQRLLRPSCTGQVTATVVVSPRIGPIMDRLAARWLATEPSVHGTCVTVDVLTKESAVMAQALGNEWDEKTQGTRPDVWVPESSVWVRQASADSDAERLMPDRQPSLARTPAVIAMPRPMAQLLKWPNTKLTWKELLNTLTATGWSKYGGDFGSFNVGMTDPARSTAGLLALMAVLDSNDDGEVSATEQADLLNVKKAMKIYREDTRQIFDELRRTGAQSQAESLRLLSAFPALEQDVLAYNESNPPVPLVAVYPSDSSADADHPYLVLNADWVTPAHRDAAEAFLTYLRGADGRQAFAAEGFRNANRTAGSGLVPENGFADRVPTLPRSVLLADSVKRTLDTWTAVTRPTNVLVVFDADPAMATTVPGLAKTRVDLTRTAITESLRLFDTSARVGLWSTGGAFGDANYRTVVAVGSLTDKVSGANRRDALLKGTAELRTSDNNGDLFGTVWAAQQEMRRIYQPGATNIVVVVTAAQSPRPGDVGMAQDELIAKLTAVSADKAKRVSVVMVAVGPEPSASTLAQISAATGARSWTSPAVFDLNQVLLSAIFGAV